MIAGGLARLAALRGWRRAVAAAILGALAASALPPLFVLPALLLAFPGLLVLIGSARGWGGAFGCGFWFGFGYHVVGLYWITDAILLRASDFWFLVPVAVPGLAAVLAVFVAAPCVVARLAAPGARRALALAGAWTLADLARQFVLTGFPWNPLGSVWALPGPVGTALIQPAALVGVPGLTLATVLLACVPALGRRAALVGVALLVLWAGYGFWRVPASAAPGSGPAAVLVQGNIDVAAKHDRGAAIATFETYLALTRAGVTQAHAARPGSPLLVVWPETASPFLLDEDRNAAAAVAEAAGPGALVLAGSVRFGTDQRPRNSLVAIDASAKVLGTYDKWHLVPFGEYQPSWARIGVQLVPGDGFAAGPGPRTLRVPGWPAIGPLICYEAIFPAQVVDRDDRPGLLINITNDAWFGRSTGPRQHLAAARLRAVEQGLPLLRAANTGISAAFDAWGRERARLGLGQRGALVTVPDLRRPALPPFAWAGLWLPGTLAALALVAGSFNRAVKFHE